MTGANISTDPNVVNDFTGLDTSNPKTPKEWAESAFDKLTNEYWNVEEMVQAVQKQTRQKTIEECASIASKHRIAGMRSKAGDEISKEIRALLVPKP